MRKFIAPKWVVLAGVVLGMATLSAMAIPVITGDFALNAPMSIGLWPLGGMGSLVLISLARAGSWRKEMAQLREEVAAQTAEREEAEKALRAKEEFVRNVVDTNPNLIFVKDREGRFAFVNKAGAAHFDGRTPAEVIGKLEPEILTHNTALESFQLHDRDVLDSLREKFIAEESAVNDWGNQRWFQTVKRPLFSDDGKASHVLVVATDITERKQAEMQLEAERELLRVLMDNSPDSIYFKDTQSRFTSCSRALCERFGKDHEEILGKSDFDFFDVKHAQRAFNDEQEIMRTGKPITGQVEQNPMKDGTVFWALTAKMPLRDKSNKIVGTCGISKDITAIKQAETKLEQVHKQLMEASRLAGMAEVATSVLHNVGNVLNSVNVSAALVSEKIRNSRIGNLAKAATLIDANKNDLARFFADDPKGRQLPGYLSNLALHLADEQQTVVKELGALNSNIEHIKEIVTMQQSYAKISGIAETLNVADLVEDALRMNVGAMQRHQVHIYREFGEVPPIVADKHKILQILVNLIRNAKYALDDGRPAEKRMTIRIAAKGEKRVCISVIDNGIGIPAENLTQIFGHGFTTRKDGHGFGLHSGALAARELGGSLTVESEGLGTGATFNLELPCQPESETV